MTFRVIDTTTNKEADADDTARAEGKTVSFACEWLFCVLPDGGLYCFNQKDSLFACPADRFRVQFTEEAGEIPSDCCFGPHNHPEYEPMIDAGTKFIIDNMGKYPTGDRRWTIGLYNAMHDARPRAHPLAIKKERGS